MGASKLSDGQIGVIDKLHKSGKEPIQILAKLRNDRERKGNPGAGSSAVYNFLAGGTHERGGEEIRGRTSNMPPRLISTAIAMRRKLIKKADDEWPVTWEDIRKCSTGQLPSNYQATNKQLSSNYQATIKQLGITNNI